MIQVQLLSEHESALRATLKVLEISKNYSTADTLRRAFNFDLANLCKPTKEEAKRIAYASMH